jgi:hypothetical protein
VAQGECPELKRELERRGLSNRVNLTKV